MNEDAVILGAWYEPVSYGGISIFERTIAAFKVHHPSGRARLSKVQNNLLYFEAGACSCGTVCGGWYTRLDGRLCFKLVVQDDASLEDMKPDPFFAKKQS